MDSDSTDPTERIFTKTAQSPTPEQAPWAISRLFGED